MRITRTLSLLLLGAVIALPHRAPAQVNVSINIGKQLGPEISIFAYSQPAYGDWHTSYQLWAPITVYEYRGHYYRRPAPGTRTIVVYSRNNEYFLPPPDPVWIGFDKRYDYKFRPDDHDRGRAKVRGNNGRGNGNGKAKGKGKGKT